jgi:hypothetical protein
VSIPVCKDPEKEAIRRKRISESHKGISVGKGIPKSDEHRRKIGEANKGKLRGPISEETRKKLSEGNKGRLSPKKGIPISEETKLKISRTLKGRQFTELHRQNLSAAQRGRPGHMLGHHHLEKTKETLRKCKLKEQNPNWKGGVSFEPYCPKFTNAFKERVRAYFGYQCLGCGHTWQQEEKKLSVHHVNFNKKTCCDNSIPFFVPLCSTCHNKTQKNRMFWQYWFTEMINHLYGGKCYFSKEEYEELMRDQNA